MLTKWGNCELNCFGILLLTIINSMVELGKSLFTEYLKIHLKTMTYKFDQLQVY